MTGRELIEWIQTHHAEDLIVLVEHRDEGGTYGTAERLTEPNLCRFSDELYGTISNIECDTTAPSAFIL